MIFDTHAHYDADAFDVDRDTVLSALPEAGVALVVDPGCDGKSSRAALALAEAYPHVYAAVGWHPEEWASWDGESMPLLRRLAAHPKAVAIGEIGLDYYWDKEHKALQKEMFERQLALAIEYDLPVIVHDREAHEDSLEILSCYPAARGVFHCFSGSAEMAAELIKRGWYLGFDGPVTYKNNKKAAEVLAVTPRDRLLLETDSPYLSPVPYRGQRNDSRRIPAIAEVIGTHWGIPGAEVERLALENGCRLFGIPLPE